MEEDHGVSFVFIDIDGVVNSTRSVLAAVGPIQSTESWAAIKILEKDCGMHYLARHSLDTVDPVAVGLINRVIQKSKARPVLSSSHRSYFADNTYFRSPEHLERLNLYMAALGFTFELYDITPRLHRPRGEEIERFIEASFPTARHVIIDDGNGFKGHQPLVKCDPVLGFTSQNYYTAAMLLGFKESDILL